jgi:ABC-type Fe3+ transport system permease subunit
MTPVIIVVFLLSVIRIFSSFETELLLGVPWGFYVYSTKIVDLAHQEPPLVDQAAALGSVILLFLAAFIPLQRRLITRRQFTTVMGQFKPRIIDLGAWRYPATAFVALVIFLLDVVPILSVLGGSFMTRFGFFNLPKTWTLEYWHISNPPAHDFLIAFLLDTLSCSQISSDAQLQTGICAAFERNNEHGSHRSRRSRSKTKRVGKLFQELQRSAAGDYPKA